MPAARQNGTAALDAIFLLFFGCVADASTTRPGELGEMWADPVASSSSSNKTMPDGGLSLFYASILGL
ncbi:hypothetical protein V6N12_070331 [Hibiscus sabdariffa]|uniref:Secreted protein n=1 Tax=Hibiscus sabdariffa TaxID=183260 RepID=A0ABR2FGM8_9ROSI